MMLIARHSRRAWNYGSLMEWQKLSQPSTKAKPTRATTWNRIASHQRSSSSNWGTSSQISGHAQKSLGSYALLAIAREPFELCPYFKSPPPVSRRELSIDLTRRASGPKAEFPAPEIATKIGCAQGELGVLKSVGVKIRINSHSHSHSHSHIVVSTAWKHAVEHELICSYLPVYNSIPSLYR